MGIQADLERRRQRHRLRAAAEEIADLIDSTSLAFATREQGFGRDTPVDVNPNHLIDSCLEIAAGDKRAVFAGLRHPRFDELKQAFQMQTQRRRMDPTAQKQFDFILSLGVLLYQRDAQDRL